MKARLKTSKTIYLLVAASLLVVLAVFATMRFRQAVEPPRRAPVAAPPIDPTKLHADWLAAVRRMTDGLRADSPRAEFSAAKTGLLELRVTAADREAHAGLVMALLALERGDVGAFDSWLAARRAAGL